MSFNNCPDRSSLNFYETSALHLNTFVFFPDHVEDPKGNFMLPKLTGWRLFVIIFVAIIGLGVCAMVGFIVFSKRQENQRKRFY